jgi:DNA-directed RNA polymerase subunit K/omega
MTKQVTPVVSHFERVLITAVRVRELHRGARPLVNINAKPPITANAEIDAGKIGREYLLRVK